MLTRETQIEVSPEELAEEWWAMDNEQQARFFNTLGAISFLEDQLVWVNIATELNDVGRNAMRAIGESLNHE